MLATKKLALIAFGVPVLAIVWSVITTPTFFAPVTVEFEWTAQDGFSQIRTVGKFASRTDPPYDRWLSNPLVTAQVRPKLSSLLKDAGFRTAKGHLEWTVAGSMIVVGRQPMSESGSVEGEKR